MYIAICADRGSTTASCGTNVQDWGYWPADPGERAVDLRCTRQIAVFGTPGRWTFKPTDTFVAESGHVVETPHPLVPGTYLVPLGGGVTRLTVTSGSAWSLEDGVTIDDVMCKQCKCGRYTGAPLAGARVFWSRYFPVPAGEPLPAFYDVLMTEYAIVPFIREKNLTPGGGAPLSPTTPPRGARYVSA
jgi:hypothetical protein